MKLDTLASLIIDVTETFDPDEMISISAMPDKQIVCQYYCDPRTGASLLSTYPEEKVAAVFAECNTLQDATAKVASLYREQPLDADENKFVRSFGLQSVMNSTYAIANNRDLGGCKQSHEAILALVVTELREFLSTFHT